MPSGFVDWRELLRPLAEELNLDIDQESDLVACAQFHVNSSGNNRHRLHRAVIEALSADNPPTENHRLLARLPIATWWTTNYDKLIETALKDAGKIVDVKSAVPQLADMKPRRDAVVFKMHGDVDRPDEAVVTRDDYERYGQDRGAFINALAGDLVTKTFLFLGFSFTDPNLEQVLTRVRLTFKTNQRRHYAIFRMRTKLPHESDEAFAHAHARQALVLQDLLRFNIQAILVDEYSDITKILAEFERRYRRQTIFVGAAAASFDPWGEDAVTAFMRALGSALVTKGMRIATGLGLGVGNALLTGAIESVIQSKAGHIEDYLIIRPFPQAIADAGERARVWDAYRQEIVGSSGIAIFLFGNKMVGTAVVPSDGMRRKFEIAQEKGLVLLPIGATGSIAKQLADDLLASTTPGGVDPAALSALASPVTDLMTLVTPIVETIGKIREGK
ncbi:SIR2 family protein [Bradyrhizobium sp. CCBAU 11430]|uniref:SIR2 family protein n=1 Tax=Bradyrhizobium sp. CCBAU 11430 TaxID=1630881 RepID=UPI00230699C2|nr:SIR2 family protein [Bradyrhizobium sp. CCBAU 11430]